MMALRSFNISTVNTSTANGIPVTIQSSNANTLLRFKNLTDLPLVQSMQINKTYEISKIVEYAHAVRPSLDLLVYYPSNSPIKFSVDSQSELVRELHRHNISVQVSEGKIEGMNDVEVTKMIALKGVDGVFTDYPLAKRRAFELIGSQSTLF